MKNMLSVEMNSVFTFVIPFLLLTCLHVDRTHCAPAVEGEEMDVGCYYMFNHYGEGDRILTNEPCLNCTCHNSMLMCYLRVCPFTKPIGQDCTVEKKPDQCCPVISCPQVPVSLVTPSALTSTTMPSTTLGSTSVSSSTELANYYERGCEIEDKYYPDGAQVAGDPTKPCELCYCIRNKTACVMQECILHVEGCEPIFQPGVCCPVRYQCDYPPQLTDQSTVAGLITTTLSSIFTSTPVPRGCLSNGEYYADGSQIPDAGPSPSACEHCYCMKGKIVCAVQECGDPLENEGGNCTAIPPGPGSCCPNKYTCETELPSSDDTQGTTIFPIISEEIKISDTETEGQIENEPELESQTQDPSISIPALESELDKDAGPAPTDPTELFSESSTTKIPEKAVPVTDSNNEIKPDDEPERGTTSSSIVEEPVSAVSQSSKPLDTEGDSHSGKEQDTASESSLSDEGPDSAVSEVTTLKPTLDIESSFLGDKTEKPEAVPVAATVASDADTVNVESLQGIGTTESSTEKVAQNSTENILAVSENSSTESSSLDEKEVNESTETPKATPVNGTNDSETVTMGSYELVGEKSTESSTVTGNEGHTDSVQSIPNATENSITPEIPLSNDANIEEEKDREPEILGVTTLKPQANEENILSDDHLGTTSKIETVEKETDTKIKDESDQAQVTEQSALKPEEIFVAEKDYENGVLTTSAPETSTEKYSSIPDEEPKIISSHPTIETDEKDSQTQVTTALPISESSTDSKIIANDSVEQINDVTTPLSVISETAHDESGILGSIHEESELSSSTKGPSSTGVYTEDLLPSIIGMKEGVTHNQDVDDSSLSSTATSLDEHDNGEMKLSSTTDFHDHIGEVIGEITVSSTPEPPESLSMQSTSTLSPSKVPDVSPDEKDAENEISQSGENQASEKVSNAPSKPAEIISQPQDQETVSANEPNATAERTTIPPSLHDVVNHDQIIETHTVEPEHHQTSSNDQEPEISTSSSIHHDEVEDSLPVSVTDSPLKDSELPDDSNSQTTTDSTGKETQGLSDDTNSNQNAHTVTNKDSEKVAESESSQTTTDSTGKETQGLSDDTNSDQNAHTGTNKDSEKVAESESSQTTTDSTGKETQGLSDDTNSDQNTHTGTNKDSEKVAESGSSDNVAEAVTDSSVKDTETVTDNLVEPETVSHSSVQNPETVTGSSVKDAESFTTDGSINDLGTITDSSAKVSETVSDESAKYPETATAGSVKEPEAIYDGQSKDTEKGTETPALETGSGSDVTSKPAPGLEEVSEITTLSGIVHDDAVTETGTNNPIDSGLAATDSSPSEDKTKPIHGDEMGLNNGEATKSPVESHNAVNDDTSTSTSIFSDTTEEGKETEKSTARPFENVVEAGMDTSDSMGDQSGQIVDKPTQSSIMHATDATSVESTDGNIPQVTSKPEDVELPAEKDTQNLIPTEKQPTDINTTISPEVVHEDSHKDDSQDGSASEKPTSSDNAEESTEKSTESSSTKDQESLKEGMVTETPIDSQKDEEAAEKVTAVPVISTVQSDTEKEVSNNFDDSIKDEVESSTAAHIISVDDQEIRTTASPIDGESYKDPTVESLAENTVKPSSVDDGSNIGESTQESISNDETDAHNTTPTSLGLNTSSVLESFSSSIKPHMQQSEGDSTDNPIISSNPEILSQLGDGKQPSEFMEVTTQSMISKDKVEVHHDGEKDQDTSLDGLKPSSETSFIQETTVSSVSGNASDLTVEQVEKHKDEDELLSILSSTEVAPISQETSPNPGSSFDTEMEHKVHDGVSHGDSDVATTPSGDQSSVAEESSTTSQEIPSIGKVPESENIQYSTTMSSNTPTKVSTEKGNDSLTGQHSTDTSNDETGEILGTTVQPKLGLDTETATEASLSQTETKSTEMPIVDMKLPGIASESGEDSIDKATELSIKESSTISDFALTESSITSSTESYKEMEILSSEKNVTGPANITDVTTMGSLLPSATDAGDDLEEKFHEDHTSMSLTDSGESSSSGRIPGEGGCFVEGKTYGNGSRIPPSTPCHIMCACQNSIVHCLLVHCKPPPSNFGDCKPMYKSGVCCPEYDCADTTSSASVTVTPGPNLELTKEEFNVVTVTPITPTGESIQDAQDYLSSSDSFNATIEEATSVPISNLVEGSTQEKESNDTVSDSDSGAGILQPVQDSTSLDSSSEGIKSISSTTLSSVPESQPSATQEALLEISQDKGVNDSTTTEKASLIVSSEAPNSVDVSSSLSSLDVEKIEELLNSTSEGASSPLSPGTYYPVKTTTSVTPSSAPWPYPTSTPATVMSTGACLFDGRVYMSAQQIPRDDPCDFCFCFRGDIICLQQSCPPPIPGCYEEPIPGFCCPRYECPVGNGNVTTQTPLFPPSYYHNQLLNGVALAGQNPGAMQASMPTGPGCEIQGEYYESGQIITSTSGPCLECRCGATGMMECDPRECQPEPMLRKMIAAITSR